MTDSSQLCRVLLATDKTRLHLNSAHTLIGSYTGVTRGHFLCHTWSGQESKNVCCTTRASWPLNFYLLTCNCSYLVYQVKTWHLIHTILLFKYFRKSILEVKSQILTAIKVHVEVQIKILNKYYFIRTEIKLKKCS